MHWFWRVAIGGLATITGWLFAVVIQEWAYAWQYRIAEALGRRMLRLYPAGQGNLKCVISVFTWPLVQTVPVTGVVMVTTPQEVALADAVKAMNMFLLPQIAVPILGVVENMAWFTPAELPENKYFIFGQGAGKKLVKESNSVLLGQIPIVQSIREGGDSGIPAILQNDNIVSEAFLNVAKNTLRQVALRNEMMAPTKVVGV